MHFTQYKYCPKKFLKTNAEFQIVDCFSQWHESATLKLLSVCPRLEQMSKHVKGTAGQVSHYVRVTNMEKGKKRMFSGYGLQLEVSV